MSLTKEAVTTALRGVATPMGNLIDTGIARAITVEPNGDVRFVMEIDPAHAQAMEAALAQAEAAIRALAGEAAHWSPRADSAALKVSGAAVWSAGEIAAPDTETLTLLDEQEECYRRLSLRDGRLVGAVLYGDIADAGFYMDLIKRGAPVGDQRAALPFGAAFMRAAA